MYLLLGFFLLIMVGACCCVYYKVYPWPVNFFNILYYTLFSLLCIISFSKVNIDMNSLLHKQNVIMFNWFFIFYIIGFIIYSYIFIPKAIETISSGSFLIAYEELRQDGNLYGSTLEKWLYYFVSRLNYPALIIGFIYLCLNKGLRGTILILSAISAIGIYAVYIVSRTDIFQIVVIVAVLYVLFKNSIPSKVRKATNKTLLVLAITVIAFGIAITLSRTEYKDDNLWFFDYFGRSVLTFNSIMEYPIVHNDGLNFFGTLTSFSIAHPSYTGKEFIPLLGRFYVDFGYLSFFIFMIIPLCLPRKVETISSFYIVMFIFITVILGNMYSHFTFSETVFALIIYIILYFAFRPKREKKISSSAFDI